MTSEEFMNYYETRHAPFVLATLGAILSPCDLPISYSRNFAFKGQSSPFADFEYDVVTEFVFASRENYNVSFLYLKKYTLYPQSVIVFLINSRTSWLPSLPPPPLLPMRENSLT